ncbi:transglycosylase SLT domain-containing protein [Streptomyces buecherae]|uniref:transglycosylase SLT domain-containing protein n=1 Tax=Streptomyces buecherae TaxID=2763006 RepID=UPI00164D9895|nr:transglycosylase SLT domain-containing protein [Streptomyces buecherae]QNJ42020.1 transglycosylase SLT domain-containing protein [Streptomyces buecherae]
MAEGRTPIKVGSGYIEIYPDLDRDVMSRLRGKIIAELRSIGTAAGKEIAEAAEKGLKELPRDVARQAKKAAQAAVKEAKDSAETIERLEREVTRQYGQEAGRRLQEMRDFYRRQEALQQDASATTRRALRETVRQEERAAQDRIAAERARVREAERLAVQQRREAERQQREITREAERQQRLQVQAQRAALRQQVQAQREATRQQIADIRAQAAAQRASLQDGIAAQQRTIANLRTQIRDVRRGIQDTTTTTQNFFKRAETSLRRTGTWFDQVGTHIHEAGTILTQKFLGPLAVAGSTLTAIGVKNADTRLLGQLGLRAAGVSPDVAAKQMKAIQHYAIDTPFSIDVMHEYQMKLIRSMAGADKNWFSKNPDKRTTASNKAAAKTTELIRAIGDGMARAGNLNPQEFARAMYAIDKIMDRDRAPTRNVTQLVNATGIPAAELANLLGFESSEAMWKKIGTPANKGGGVTGVEIVNSLLKNWEGTDGRKGSKGYAEQTTSATISGRIQQMKERAAFELGNLFAKENKQGIYEYTPLGERLMGKKTALRDMKGEITGYEYRGGLLEQLQEMAKEYGPALPKALGIFMDALESGADTIESIAEFLREHSYITETAEAFAKFLIEWGPLILAVGLLSKVIGKVTGLVGRAFTPLAAVTRGAVRGARGGGNLRQQLRARRTARTEAREAGRSPEAITQAGQAAYRQQRTTNRGGDARGLGRRMWDGLIGTSGGSDDTRSQRAQIRALEDQITEAQRQAAELRDELRQVNSQTMRQIADALAGSGGASVGGAASQVQGALRQAQTQAQALNTTPTNGLRRELDAVRAAADGVTSSTRTSAAEVGKLDGLRAAQVRQQLDAVKAAADGASKAVRNASGEVRTLDGRKLGSLRVQQIETTTKRTDQLRNAVRAAADQVGKLDGKSLSALRNHFKATTTAANGTEKATKNVSAAVVNLAGRSLRALRQQFDSVTTGANEAYKKVGQGTGAGSLAGRIGLLNQRSLKDITKRVEDLAGALDKAQGHAKGTDEALGSIAGKAPGGGGGGKPNRRARGGVINEGGGGVLPGYAPWIDKIPALLSPGEAVLRPEVTNVLGEARINAWNEAAIRGQLSRHARGGIAGKGNLSLDSIKDYIAEMDIAPMGKAATKVMGLDASSDALGGPTKRGILGVGDIGARYTGTKAAERFRGMYDWITEDSWQALRRIPSLVGQVAGVVGGAVAPTLKDHFWDDIWRGSGNIVERGQRFLGHVFSMDTLGSIWDDLAGGVLESASSLWDTVTSVVKDPIGAVTGGVDDIYGIIRGSINNYVAMFETVKEIMDSPKAYAGRVAGEFLSTAKEAMPNTKGLFDFDKGSRVTDDMPGDGGLSSKPGPGNAVTQWAPVAKTAMTMLGIPHKYLSTVLHRIQVESGGNPSIINMWDSNWAAGHPSVGLLQVIGPTFRTYAGPFARTQPSAYGTSMNPLANIYAGLNYATHRYGARWPQVLAGTSGYWTGTRSASPGLALVGELGPELVSMRGGERVWDHEETKALLNGGPRYEIHVHEARTEPTPQAVMRALQQAEALYSPL